MYQQPVKFTNKPKTEAEGYHKPKAHKHHEKKDKEEREKERHVTRKEPKERTLEFSKGGKVKHTGKALVHKGEVVLPVSLVNKMKRLLK